MDSIGEADSVTNVDDITDAGISGFSYEYGVFLSAEPGDVDAMKEYRCVVIDAQEFSAEDIRRMHDLGQTVYSYINIGSVEKFRDYYDDYADITLGKYENWEDESWVDVSSDKWQKFITGTLAKDLEAKGIDGFFVDNADVYYQYPTSKICEGVGDMLKALRLTGKEVILNGGDTFVSRYLEDGAALTRPCSLSLKEHGIGHDGSSFLVPKNIKKCLTVHWWTAVLCAKPEKKGLYIPEFHA